MKYVIDGIEIIGKSQDFGYENQFFLVKSPDKRFIQVTPLLYNLISILQEETDLEIIAQKLGDIENRKVNREQILFLIEKKLVPLGIIATFGSTAYQKRNTPNIFIGVSFSFTLFPEFIVNNVSSIFLFLFYPPLMLLVLTGSIILSIWVIFFHGVFEAVKQTITHPFLFLPLFGIVVASAIFHEYGHATGCKYSGGKPGKIGAGLYIMWPAFFTDLTDTYRLNRWGRLRSDIGGVYFHLIFSFILGILFFLTKFEPLLLLIAFLNIEIIQQLIPFLRLDGYFVLADIVGIADLYNKIIPIIKEIIFRKHSEATVNMKQWAKWTVFGWTVSTIPLLGYFMVQMIINSPVLITSLIAACFYETQAIVTSFLDKDYVVTLVQVLQFLLLTLPNIGFIIIIGGFTRGVIINMIFKRFFSYALRFKKTANETFPIRR